MTLSKLSTGYTQLIHRISTYPQVKRIIETPLGGVESKSIDNKIAATLHRTQCS